MINIEMPPHLSRSSVSPHTSASSCNGSSPVPQVIGVSLGKHIIMCTQFLSQMEQWHSQLEKGGITQYQYKLQSAILRTCIFIVSTLSTN